MKQYSFFACFVGIVFCGCDIKRDDEWKTNASEADLKQYKVAFHTFMRFHGRFPSADEGFRALYSEEVLPRADQTKWKGPYCCLERTDKDGFAVDWWRRRLVYNMDGNNIVLSSAGADGVLGNADDCVLVVSP